jgi:hypothetical protein
MGLHGLLQGFLGRREGKTRWDRVRNEIFREARIKNLLMELEEMVWPCQKNGQNKDSKKSFRLKF